MFLRASISHKKYLFYSSTDCFMPTRHELGVGSSLLRNALRHETICRINTFHDLLTDINSEFAINRSNTNITADEVHNGLR